MVYAERGSIAVGLSPITLLPQLSRQLSMLVLLQPEEEQNKEHAHVAILGLKLSKLAEGAVAVPENLRLEIETHVEEVVDRLACYAAPGDKLAVVEGTWVFALDE